MEIHQLSNLTVPNYAAKNIHSVNNNGQVLSDKKNNVDTVEISDTAKLFTTNNNVSNKQDYNEKLLQKAYENPGLARDLANNYAGGLDLLYIPSMPASLKIEDTFYADGTSVTDRTYLQNFNKEASIYREERIELYNTEKAKGTSDADILSKLFDYYSNLPESYQKKIGYS